MKELVTTFLQILILFKLCTVLVSILTIYLYHCHYEVFSMELEWFYQEIYPASQMVIFEMTLY